MIQQIDAFNGELNPGRTIFCKEEAFAESRVKAREFRTDTGISRHRKQPVVCASCVAVDVHTCVERKRNAGAQEENRAERHIGKHMAYKGILATFVRADKHPAEYEVVSYIKR